MRNVLSVDVEDYFHVEAFAGCAPPAAWHSFAPRVERNVRRALEIFGRREVRGTFFVLGWVAERHPGVVREIVAAGNEVGCHGFGHRHIGRMTPEMFRADVVRARDCLGALTGKPVVCYRAPSFSIARNTLWALEILAEEGFRVDSSIFPVRHDLYGLPDAPRFPHRRGRILEFPPSTVRLFGVNLGVGGGGYLRHFPYLWTRWALRRINRREGQPAMVYFHPWELDPDQPRIRAPLRSQLRHYRGLAGMESKILRLLGDFSFDTLSEVSRSFT